MPDYSAYHLPGNVITLRSGGRIARGEPVMAIDRGTVTRFRSGGEYVGIAAHGAATDELVAVFPGGAIQSGRAEGQIHSGAPVEISAVRGRQVTEASAGDAAQGVAVSDATDGQVVFWMQRSVHGAPPPAGPDVQAIAPASGPSAGGTPVTITGVRFTGASRVTIGGVDIGNPVPVSDTEITGTTPVRPAGPATVRVETIMGGDDLPGGFTYTAPAVTGVSPTHGGTGGGDLLTITGQRLTGATGVTIGGNQATGFAPSSDTEVICRSPSGTAGGKDVVITGPPGSTPSPPLANGFTYLAVPNPQIVAPTSGEVAGGLPITITGTGASFGNGGATGATLGTAVDGRNPVANFTVTGVNQITGTTPAWTGPPGPVQVQVSGPSGTGTMPGSFTYNAPFEEEDPEPDPEKPGGRPGLPKPPGRPAPRSKGT